MRKIKFRSWDGRQYWRDVAVMNSRPFVLNNGEDSLVDLFTNEQIMMYGEPIIEQFTGLRDKNGKEIYEGDIIRVLYSTQEQGKPDSFCVPCEAIIRWSRSGWEIAWAYYSQPLDIDGNGEICWRSEQHRCLERYAYYKLSQFEVVGNIHENPELLKSS